MRVVSLVPSLTETLIECGVDVVGRTRFCIHPDDRVDEIAVVGGTKEVNWDRCRELAPDLVVMDQEENTREMADACPFPWVATHVTSVESVADQINLLADRTGNTALSEVAGRWRQLLSRPSHATGHSEQIPGQIARLNGNPMAFERLEYVIWRDPWMAAGRDTFIGSMLAQVGLAGKIPGYTEKYPAIDAPRDDTFYLFSSEPFPFERYVDELTELGFNGALIDGEFYSWFGVRSLRLLEDYLE